MYTLLNPGPVNISERVRQSLLKADMCHREPEFYALQDRIREKLTGVYGLSGEWAAVILTGSGTAAMEAMLSSFCDRNEKILIIENGIYGERLTEIATIHGIAHSRLTYDWMDNINTADLEERIDKSITAIAVVHHETTTGRLNRLAEIGNIASRYKVPVLLDGVSSFGAEEIRFNQWNIMACAATANKCLHAVPGISFVIVNREFINSKTVTRNTFYLDLNRYLVLQDKQGTPFTQSVQVMYALDEALSEHEEQGGWTSRNEFYREKMTVLTEGLSALGIRSCLPPGESSSVLRSFNLPDGINYESFHDGLKSRGFIIYSGQGQLLKTLFRVSLMGETTVDDTRRFLEAVKQVIADS